ncbi:MAG: hypothetical protein LW650_15540 [Planctomycetaceae bacterium]|nr:hypothetical protein [Planctomycetaceae bacterium]
MSEPRVEKPMTHQEMKDWFASWFGFQKDGHGRWFHVDRQHQPLDGHPISNDADWLASVLPEGWTWGKKAIGWECGKPRYHWWVQPPTGPRLGIVSSAPHVVAKARLGTIAIEHAKKMSKLTAAATCANSLPPEGHVRLPDGRDVRVSPLGMGILKAMADGDPSCGSWLQA